MLLLERERETEREREREGGSVGEREFFSLLYIHGIFSTSKLAIAEAKNREV